MGRIYEGCLGSQKAVRRLQEASVGYRRLSEASQKALRMISEAIRSLQKALRRLQKALSRL